MVKLTEKDLEKVYLLIVRPDKEHRATLPIVRRHWNSVQNQCRFFVDRNIDIFYSGVFIARKRKNEAKIVMDREYQRYKKDDQHVFGVSV